jgi:hypothetical protein
MPLALERQLKRKVAGNKMSKERKDAYVYGTLRKTGWKPERERKKELSARLDKLIQFDIGGWRVRKSADIVGPSGRVTGTEYKPEKAPGFGSALKRNAGKIALPAIGAVTGAALGHAGWGRARPGKPMMKLAGLFEEGEGLTVPALETAGRPASATPGLVGAGIGALGFLPAGIQADREKKGHSIMNQAYSMAVSDYRQRHGITRRPVEMSAKEKPIRFGAEILGPWHGKTGHTSKIDQYHFPAGLSPAAALQFPLPVLMKYLNQRNLLQQQFSWKHERLIQLSAKLDEIHASAHPTQ